MPKLPCYRLRIVIPALVCLATLMIDGYQTWHSLTVSRSFFMVVKSVQRHQTPINFTFLPYFILNVPLW